MTEAEFILYRESDYDQRNNNLPKNVHQQCVLRKAPWNYK